MPKIVLFLVFLCHKHAQKPVLSGNEIKYLPNPRDSATTTRVPREKISIPLSRHTKSSISEQNNSPHSGAFVQQTRTKACSFWK
jgi:hypothetical protein